MTSSITVEHDIQQNDTQQKESMLSVVNKPIMLRVVMLIVVTPWSVTIASKMPISHQKMIIKTIPKSKFKKLNCFSNSAVRRYHLSRYKLFFSEENMIMHIDLH